MNVNYHISPYPSLLEDMLAVIYEVSPAGVESEVDQQSIPAPHNDPVSISFVGLDKVTHRLKLFSDPSAALLHSFLVQPTADLVTVFTPIRFRIGDGGPYTPVAGTNTYVNPNMIGLTEDDYLAFRNGYGYMFEGVHITNDPVNGGFSLIIEDDQFNGDPAEEWTIIRKDQVVTTIVNDSVVGKQWGATTAISDIYVDIFTAVDFIPAHLRKVIRLNGPSAIYSFGAIDVPPIGYPFRVINFGTGATSPAPRVNFNNAPLMWGATTKAFLELPLYSACEFVWDGGVWNMTVNSLVVLPPPAVELVGKGVLVIGNIPNASFGYTITHNLGISGAYMVLGSIKSKSANHDRDNTITWAWHDAVSNSFKISVQEIYNETQDVDFTWMIVKL